MKKPLLLVRRKFLKRVFSFFGITSALFIFQACYGAPQDLDAPNEISGTVFNDGTNQRVAGIRVINTTEQDTCITDSSGSFSISCVDPNSVLRFEDADGTQNGLFDPLDSNLTPTVNYRGRDVQIRLAESKDGH